MKKFLLGATAALFISHAHAEEVINDSVRKRFEETQAALEQSAEQMNQQMQQVMPVVADSMTHMMMNFFQALPPLIKSIEENQVLSKAAAQINNEIDSQVKLMNKEIKTLEEQEQEPNNDKFVISGSKDDNGKKLDFNFSQNDQALAELQNAITIKTTPDSKETFSLNDLKNQKLRGDDFKIKKINRQDYLVYDDGDEYCYITGIMNNNIIVRILTTGEEAPERARNFIKNSNQKLPML